MEGVTAHEKFFEQTYKEKSNRPEGGITGQSGACQGDCSEREAVPHPHGQQQPTQTCEAPEGAEPESNPERPSKWKGVVGERTSFNPRHHRTREYDGQKPDPFSENKRLRSETTHSTAHHAAQEEPKYRCH